MLGKLVLLWKLLLGGCTAAVRLQCPGAEVLMGRLWVNNGGVMTDGVDVIAGAVVVIADGFSVTAAVVVTYAVSDFVTAAASAVTVTAVVVVVYRAGGAKSTGIAVKLLYCSPMLLSSENPTKIMTIIQ